jgi:probable rRNA maturation factor
MIYFHSEDISLPQIEKRKLKNWIKKVVELEDKKVGNISIIFCSDEYLLEVNKKFLKHNFYTDVITFDYVEENIINGDIFISKDRVFDNAEKRNIVFLDEVNRVMIHGVLHLLGYKDKLKEEIVLMREKENKYLDIL